MKYLVIITDKFKFSEHISYVAERCTKQIHSLNKSAKVSWGLTHEKLKTVYKVAILPIRLYGAPVWIEAFEFKYIKLKYIRVLRLMNIKITKQFRTTSSQTLCILAGTIPINIKAKEVVKQYNIRKGIGSQTQPFERELELKNWTHPAYAVKIIEAKGYQDQTIQAYTDGSKNEHGVGSGVTIFIGKDLAVQLKFKLGNKCSNNKSEKLAIFKALVVIETIEIPENSPRTATIFTDSRISIDSLKNVNNHTYLIEETMKKIFTLERANWTTEFSWVKAHVGIYRNELDDQLAKAAARNRITTSAF
jgi:ribonuclease HI